MDYSTKPTPAELYELQTKAITQIATATDLIDAKVKFTESGHCSNVFITVESNVPTLKTAKDIILKYLQIRVIFDNLLFADGKMEPGENSFNESRNYYLFLAEFIEASSLLKELDLRDIYGGEVLIQYGESLNRTTEVNISHICRQLYEFESCLLRFNKILPTLIAEDGTIQTHESIDSLKIDFDTTGDEIWKALDNSVMDLSILELTNDVEAICL